MVNALITGVGILGKYLAAMAALSITAVAASAAHAAEIYYYEEGFATTLFKRIALPGAGKYNIVLTTELESSSGGNAEVRAEYDLWAGTPDNPGPMTPNGNEFYLYQNNVIFGRYGVYFQFEVPKDYTVQNFNPGGYTGLEPGAPFFMLMEFKRPSTAVGFSAYQGTNYTLTISAAPEPSAWALMIMGFGSAGGMIRQRRRQSAA